MPPGAATKTKSKGAVPKPAPPPLYPIRFKEIYKAKIWGGPELKKALRRLRRRYALAQVEIDGYLGITGKEFRQQGRQVEHPEGHGCGQPHQPARHRCSRQCGVLGCFALGENVRSPACELPSGVGQGETPRCAVDEPRAQPRLNPADGFRDGGFGKLQLRCRPREGANLNDLGEDRQAFEIWQSGHGIDSETMCFQGFYF